LEKTKNRYGTLWL